MIDPSRIKPEAIQEVIREAEAYLSAQLTCAVAADQRAVTLSGALATIATALFGVGLAALSQDKPSHMVGWAAVVSGALYIAALVFAVWASRPVSFSYVGNTPENWDKEADLYGSLTTALYQQAGYYTSHIKSNDAVMRKNARLIQCALWLSICAPVVGVIVGLVVHSGVVPVGA